MTPSSVVGVGFGIFTGQISYFTSTNQVFGQLNSEFGDLSLNFAMNSSFKVEGCGFHNCCVPGSRMDDVIILNALQFHD